MDWASPDQNINIKGLLNTFRLEFGAKICPEYMVKKKILEPNTVYSTKCWRLCTVLYLETSVLLEALSNSVNPKDPISVTTL